MQIIVCLLVVIHLISSWKIKLFEYSPAIVVVIGRPMHTQNHKYGNIMLQMQDIHMCIMPEEVICLCQPSSLVSCQLLLPWCAAITGH